ncbi:hypothetical protein BC827DRAFT_1226792 [Russula dissimulans]|nr:hypothetical protein BC827DRAFT_1226792 [Russula dissimulans]
MGAQTRKYQRGRTEVVSVASPQSKAWVDVMVDHRVTARVALVATYYLPWTLTDYLPRHG